MQEHGVAYSRQQFGGKACHLARLAHEGFNVPASFVISTTVFDKLMDTLLAEQTSHVNPQVLLQSAPFPDSLTSKLKEAYETFADFPLAIRSSSSDEDSALHSFAGLQHSILGVEGFDAFLAAIRTVWRSFYANDRLLYPIQTPPDARVPSMAVIVQRFIPANASGIIFTKNPVSAKPQSLLLNVGRGSGQCVVGNEAVDSLTLKRGTLTKDASFLRSYDELKDPVLSLEQIQAVCEAALKIEEIYNAPQDIEFCFLGDKLTILQTRPIANGGGSASEKRQLFSNVNVGEALSDAVTPMTWSVGMAFAQLGFDTIFKTLGLRVPAEYRFVTTFHGRIYLNASQFLSILTQIPFIDPKRLGQSAGVAKISDFDFDLERLSPWKLLGSLPRTCIELGKTQYKFWFKLKPWAKDFKKQRDEFLQLDLSKQSHAQLCALQGRVEAMLNDCGQSMLMAAASFLLSHQLLLAILHAVASREDAQSMESALFSGLRNVRSADPGLALLQIAHGIRRQAPLMQRFLAAENFDNSHEFMAELRQMPEASAFLQAFDEFMKKYGLRTTQEAELATARWSEEPSYLLQILQAHLQTDSTKNPNAIQNDAAKIRKESTEQAFNTFFKRGGSIFKLALRMAQKSARLREEWRAYVVDCLGLYRFFLKECGARLSAQSKLLQSDDVFYLSRAELCAWLEDEAKLCDAQRIVAFRRAQQLAFMASPRMPDSFVLNHRKVKQGQRQARQQFQGIAASPGTVVARARVLHSPAQGAKTLQHGEIIVARYTDVGWTPLFLLASALLTQQGGPLSHSCVVAREYGLPAIVAIPSLLEQVKTGDILHLCADMGIVSIVERAQEP
jgi:phosphohistidine swiveling domain-containing protein